jgi:hypothetical protein
MIIVQLKGIVIYYSRESTGTIIRAIKIKQSDTISAFPVIKDTYTKSRTNSHEVK